MRSFLSFLLLLLISLSVFSQQLYEKELKLMGSRFEIAVVADDSAKAMQYIELAVNEIRRIETLISSWDENSETSEINRNAGIKPVPVSKELFGLIQRSVAISTITDGAFDITFASMDKIWTFDGSMTKMPDDSLIASSVRKVGFDRIVLNEDDNSVYLPEHGMKIGFGALGKGYAADRAKKLLIDAGVEGGIINASGDMSTWGKQANGKDWTVAIKNPFNKESVFGTFPISGKSVVTSGNYEKFVEFDGVRYTHIIDPRTGYPSSGILSVTVFANSAELADAFATSVFVMGINVGLDRINQLKEVECIIVDSDGEIHTSQNIEIQKL